MPDTSPLPDARYGPFKGHHPKQLIVLLHGPDALPENMQGFAEAMEPHFPNARFLAPEAPYGRTQHPGRRFWLPHNAHSNDELLEGLREVTPRLDAYIDAALAADELPAQAMALVGFSEGALVALYAGLRRHTSPAGILSFCGALVGADALKEEITVHPPVYLIQGDQDPALPTHVLADSVAGLMRAGVQADSHLCLGMGHTVNKEAINRGARFLTRIFHIPRNPHPTKPASNGSQEGLWHRLTHPHLFRHEDK